MNHEPIANKIISELSNVGIKAYIWHVANTGSVYIRFDDIRMGSIRLGDHEGRSKLKYKWNVRSDIKGKHKTWVKDGENWRYFVHTSNWKQLIPILVDRYTKAQNWEKSKYTYNIPYHKQK